MEETATTTEEATTEEAVIGSLPFSYAQTQGVLIESDEVVHKPGLSLDEWG